MAPPHSATRYIETSVGVLSYLELALLLAERVEDAEVEIRRTLSTYQSPSADAKKKEREYVLDWLPLPRK